MRFGYSVFPDGITFKCFYGRTFLEEEIISVSMVEKSPKTLFRWGKGFRMNGIDLGRNRFGYYMVKTDEGNKGALLLINNKKATRFVELKTTFGLCYVNCPTDEETEDMYNEIGRTLKLTPKPDLEVPKYLKMNKKFILGTFVASFLMAILTILIAFLLGSSDNHGVNVSENGVELVYAIGSREIPAEKIKSIDSVGELPPIKTKISGLETKKKNIGTFKTRENEKCKLFILNKNVKPVIVIVTEDYRCFINLETSAKTDSLFVEMKKNVQYGYSVLD